MAFGLVGFVDNVDDGRSRIPTATGRKGLHIAIGLCVVLGRSIHTHTRVDTVDVMQIQIQTLDE